MADAIERIIPSSIPSSAPRGSARNGADVLDLSLAQVEMVRELRKIIAADNPLDTAQKSQAVNHTSDKTPKRKNPGARQGKSRTRPILLTDIVASESLAVDAGDRRAEMNGAAVERRTDETFVAC